MNFKDRILKTVIFALAISAVTWLFGDVVKRNISSNVIRLHVIGASNSYEDQQIKLKVRDEILKEYGADISQNASKSEEEQFIKDNIKNIEKTAQKVLVSNGYTYGAEAQYGNFVFPEKNYGGITLPQGRYDGLRITLGDGAGNNWWCVMFPDVCITREAVGFNYEGEARLKEVLNDSGYSMISGENEDVVLRFYLFDKITGKL